MKKTIICTMFVLAISLWTFPAEKKAGENTVHRFSRVLIQAAGIFGKIRLISGNENPDPKLTGRLVRTLRNAVRLSENAEQKKCFASLVSDVKKKNLSGFSDGNMSVKNTSADLVLNFDETAGTFSPVVLVTDADESSRFSPLFNTARLWIGKGILKRNVKFFPGDAVIKFSHSVYPKSFSRESVILPPYTLHPRSFSSGRARLASPCATAGMQAVPRHRARFQLQLYAAVGGRTN